MRALKIPADNGAPMEIVDIDVRDYREAVKAIGGGAQYIERVVIGDGTARRRFEDMAMIVDGEGALDAPFNGRQPHNLRASYLYGTHIHGGRVYGNVLLVGEGYVDSGYGYPEIDFIDLPARYNVVNVDRFLALNDSRALLTKD